MLRVPEAAFCKNRPHISYQQDGLVAVWAIEDEVAGALPGDAAMEVHAVLGLAALWILHGCRLGSVEVDGMRLLLASHQGLCTHCSHQTA